MMSNVRPLLAAALLVTVALPAEAQEVTAARLEAALPQLDAMAAKAVAEGQVPGLAVVVVHKNTVVFIKGYGLREAGKPGAVDADTVFQLASFSKPISATVVAALVGEGVLDWDTAVAALDPSFRLKEAYPTQQVSVRDLFAHRSGLPGDAGNELEALGYDRATILHRLALVPPASSFRAGYSYSNFGLTAGAVAAAAPTGKPWEEVAQEKLYAPLGMASTSSRHADFLTHANRAELHIGGPGQWAAKVARQPDAQSPAGGASSTVRDLAQWMRLELGNGLFDGRRLIPAEALAATHQPLMARGANPVTGAASFYGLGWVVEYGRHGESWGHAGAFSVGARTLVTLYPQAELGIVVLANAFPTGVPEGLAGNFFDLAFDGATSQDWMGPWNAAYAGMFAPGVAAARERYAPLSDPLPAAPREAYVGRYANGYVGGAEVAAAREGAAGGGAGGGLELRLGPDGAARFPLTHFNRDIFLYYPTPEMPDVPAAVRFTLGADGKAGALTIEDLDGYGLGTLERE
ncbi:CubicO group peptidase (beta-lactamase class C family) [Ancylobacter aquaticus]|uniref:CubicO group peptidase (Beta-lactamase class C family) n=1 Tax=Ancylobacter aquaticus TaxID=100 RepID=A0A4R1IAE3_ANCAQ|nr:serine hydrolase [Ancylobacter aquaticus]TCK31281.1 CubicO group peptidase (beta-lactamase class C family) [Ancylobacter aquaticus]